MEKALKKYIDSLSADGKKELRQLLQQTSSVDRYSLLMNVRGDKYSYSGPHFAAWGNDLETMKCMLERFTSDQKYNVLKIQDYDGRSALHFAAWYSCPSIITYLLTDLSQVPKYDLLRLQDYDRDTPLHCAASQQKSEAIQAILTSFSPPQQMQLLNIKNKKRQTIPDIRPEVYKELPVVISQGIVILHVLQLRLFLTREASPTVHVSEFLYM